MMPRLASRNGKTVKISGDSYTELLFGGIPLKIRRFLKPFFMTNIKRESSFTDKELVERNCFIFSVLLNHDAPKMGNRMSGMCWETDGYAPLFADGFPCHEGIACYECRMHTEFCKHETVVVRQDICEESGVYYERKSIDCSHQDYDC